MRGCWHLTDKFNIYCSLLLCAYFLGVFNSWQFADRGL